jgi:hypothetical protein
MALFESPEGVRAPFLAGVGMRFGCFRKGDSERGRNGLFVFKTGLVEGEGPTDCENLGIGGGSGLMLVLSLVE